MGFILSKFGYLLKNCPLVSIWMPFFWILFVFGHQNVLVVLVFHAKLSDIEKIIALKFQTTGEELNSGHVCAST